MQWLSRYAVLATGSRKWRDRNAVMERFRQYPPGTILLHGAADGLDTLADQVGRERGFNVIPHAYVSEEGNAGGHFRNRLMVDLLVVYRTYRYRTAVEAFPLSDSVGTVGCMDYARQVQLDVHKFGEGWLRG